ncbi:agamous-like MADS-box protein AGL62 [Cornus florida]|uniref:agamous-like MADS-box protein AGL62 n=1 Tax=Cornus florida TaxID=4283 RepID=UPI002897849C|nr:agamous-like MADS-box protein AGL62 [Cornus florida]
MARRSKGRQKISMSKMENESNLQVTFSKRRSGLFKKASELSTLCGVEIAIVVFSPGKKVFSFGHPCVESIVERFLTRNPPPNTGTYPLIEAHRNASVRELNMQLTQVQNMVETEKKLGESFNMTRKASQSQCNWWEGPIDDLNLKQLEQLKAAMEDLKKNVDKLVLEARNPLPYTAASTSSFGRVGVPSSDARVSGLSGTMMSYGFNHVNNRGFF